MRLWRKCWQVSRVYGQPERHRGQSGSSQGSHGNTPSQEQEGATPALLMNCDPSSWQYEKPEHKDGRTVAKPLSKRSSIVLRNHPS
ncbi:hypothetical protein AAG906_037003 [Vitis piasezkii]